MREEGLVTAIGAGMNQSEMLYEFARRIDVDCFLLAGRYTLLDQSASELLLPECENRGISIILGGPYNSGMRLLRVEWFRRCPRHLYRLFYPRPVVPKCRQASLPSLRRSL